MVTNMKRPNINIKTFLLSALVASCLMVTGCSTNPATGRTQFAGLMSPEQEVTVGAQEHPKILQEYGEYDDSRLSSYVQRIGQKVTADTERPEVEYTFTVLDTDLVNAFALPGGYIYITRGLLALANNEAEMAAVLAHEAGHITARHSAERYSRAVVTSLGANILAAAIDQTGASQALGLGSELYMKSYSRAQENEADTLGIRYLARAGYAPEAMTTFLQSLQGSSALEARLAGRSGSDFSYFSTHPATADRVTKTFGEAQALNQAGVMNRNTYLNMINGMVYGESSRQGFTRDQKFIHPKIGFEFEAPEGFRIINNPTEVIATSSSGAVMVFDMASNASKRDALTYLRDVWMKNETLKSLENITINGMKAASAAFSGRINGKQMTIRLIAIEFAPDSFARFQIGIPNNASANLVEGLKRATYSFKKLSAAEKKQSRPLTLRVVTAQSGQSISSLANQMAYSGLKEERFRVLNGLNPNDQLIAGQRYKIVVQ